MKYTHDTGTGIRVDEITIQDFVYAAYENKDKEPILHFKHGGWVDDGKLFGALTVDMTLHSAIVPRIHYNYKYPYEPYTDDITYQLQKCIMEITPIDHPEYHVTINIPFDKFQYEVSENTNLMICFIDGVLEMVTDIVNGNFASLKFWINKEYNTPFFLLIMAPIIKGIFQNPDLRPHVEQMIRNLTYEKFECPLEVSITLADCIYETKLFELYKEFSTPTRAKLIEHYLNNNQPTIVAQLTHFSNPINIEDIPNDDRWTL